MNFDFLKRQDGYYDLFANACIEAEKVYAESPAMCAIGCRKALELAIKWVYGIDNTIKTPYRDNLASLVHEPTFIKAVDERVWRRLAGIYKLGNVAVHTEATVKPSDAILSLRALFDFIDWIDYSYGPDYKPRTFDEAAIPKKAKPLTPEQIAGIKKAQSLIHQQDAEIKRLEKQLKKLSDQTTEAKEERQRNRDFSPEEISELETRKHYIDWDLALAGWKLGENAIEERKVIGMPNDTGEGFIDYLLLGKDGRPLAIVEAKKTSHSEQKGMKQARLYADCLEKECGYRPPAFLTNGFKTLYVDDESGAPRTVSGFFSQDDLRKLLKRRNNAVEPTKLAVDRSIAGGGSNRTYQIEAVEHVCANIEGGHRKSLLVMATGTGKTRVSAALADVLMRSGYVKNALFLADRVALVSQAKHAYGSYLSNVSLCNLCENKEDRSARVVFSTYPTITNAIDAVRNEEGGRMFTPAHFDLIIVDEAHRSIFNKYRAVFEYFDSLVVGLTATPADEVDRNTYDFFEVERGVPTFVYEYNSAVYKDHVLVPYYGIETHTKFLDKGITYDDLSPEDREQIEDDFEEVGLDAPEEILPAQLNSWVFNLQTIDTVLETLMQKGIRVKGGQELGKTVIFAQNQKHARLIVKRFGELHPELPGDYIQAVICEDDYAHAVIDDFELKPRPVIAVSVDMLDTGIDVPEIVNLVFFKKVRSKIKFWQMIGRGTRLCEDLDVMDPIDGPHQDKERFFIFDWCHNFEYFRTDPKVVDGKNAVTLAAQIFNHQAELAKLLQERAFAGDEHQALRTELVDTMRGQVNALNEELFTVRRHRREVDIYRQAESWQNLTDVSIAELRNPLSGLVTNTETDDAALRFDNIMYGFMAAQAGSQSTAPYKNRLVLLATQLASVTSVPQVKAELPLIDRVAEGDMLDGADILELEDIRKRLRSLIQFIIKGPSRHDVITHLEDPVTDIQYGVTTEIGDNFENYRLKVERYLKDYGNETVINKLYNNKPMTELEFKRLEEIFTKELGNAEDYSATYGDTPFGLLVRKVVHLDRDAAMEAFANFLNDQSLNEQQISFVKRVVEYVITNGYMEPSKLGEPPYTHDFMRIFDQQRQVALVTIIKTIMENALTPAA